MIKLQDKNFAIRNIIDSHVDCEFTAVRGRLDKEAAFKDIISLFPEEKFVSDFDETFVAIDFVQRSGKLQGYYDPGYIVRVNLYYNEAKNVYSLAFED